MEAPATRVPASTSRKLPGAITSGRRVGGSSRAPGQQGISIWSAGQATTGAAGTRAWPPSTLCSKLASCHALTPSLQRPQQLTTNGAIQFGQARQAQRNGAARAGAVCIHRRAGRQLEQGGQLPRHLCCRLGIGSPARWGSNSALSRASNKALPEAGHNLLSRPPAPSNQQLTQQLPCTPTGSSPLEAAAATALSAIQAAHGCHSIPPLQRLLGLGETVRQACSGSGSSNCWHELTIRQQMQRNARNSLAAHASVLPPFLAVGCASDRQAPTPSCAPRQSGQAAERGQKSVALLPHLCSSSTSPRAPCGSSYSRSCPCHTVRVGVSSGCPAAFRPLAGAGTAAAVPTGAGTMPGMAPTATPAAACCGRTCAADRVSSRTQRHAAAPAMTATRLWRRAGAPAVAAAGLRLVLGLGRGAAAIMRVDHDARGAEWRRGGNEGPVQPNGVRSVTHSPACGTKGRRNERRGGSRCGQWVRGAVAAAAAVPAAPLPTPYSSLAPGLHSKECSIIIYHACMGCCPARITALLKKAAANAQAEVVLITLLARTPASAGGRRRCGPPPPGGQRCRPSAPARLQIRGHRSVLSSCCTLHFRTWHSTQPCSATLPRPLPRPCPPGAPCSTSCPADSTSSWSQSMMVSEAVWRSGERVVCCQEV